ncbi:MAG: NAD(P)H-dependent oxidoreductase [Bacillota bacterium]|nr:NAD(P)H-dependent oxidoreductase [Bacillota bacterium]
MENILICPEKPSEILRDMISSANIGGFFKEYYGNYQNLDFSNKRILFAVELGDSGVNIKLYKLINMLRIRKGKPMANSIAGVMIHCNSELYTRSEARNLIFGCNSMGCSFPGKPLVEATESLKNFINYEKYFNMTLKEACLNSCIELSERVLSFDNSKIKNPKILVLHSSNSETSNTYMLWKLVEKNLINAKLKEIHIGQEQIIDCKGCSFKTCTHFGLQNNCYYGGIMVEEIYPSIIDTDYLVLLCPNYNDSITANISAAINRLTALYRKTPFYDKSLYSVIVSGHSGSDILAKQLISGLNINKTFKLPGEFALMETANYPKDVLKVPDIEKKAKSFAENILR